MFFDVRNDSKLKPLPLPLARYRLEMTRSAYSTLLSCIDHNASRILKLVNINVYQILPRNRNGERLPKANLIPRHGHSLRVPVQLLFFFHLHLLHLKMFCPTIPNLDIVTSDCRHLTYPDQRDNLYSPAILLYSNLQGSIPFFWHLPRRLPFKPQWYLHASSSLHIQATCHYNHVRFPRFLS